MRNYVKRPTNSNIAASNNITDTFNNDTIDSKNSQYRQYSTIQRKGHQGLDKMIKSTVKNYKAVVERNKSPILRKNNELDISHENVMDLGNSFIY